LYLSLILASYNHILQTILNQFFQKAILCCLSNILDNGFESVEMLENPRGGVELAQKTAIFDNCKFGPGESQGGNEKLPVFQQAV